MPGFEYMFLGESREFDASNLDSGTVYERRQGSTWSQLDFSVDFLDRLNELGKDGWETVGGPQYTMSSRPIDDGERDGTVVGSWHFREVLLTRPVP